MSVTLLDFFRFDGAGARWEAFRRVPSVRSRLAGTPHLHFGKYMGSGAGRGFSLKPDWSTYAMLTVWPSEERARDFERHNSVLQELREASESRLRLSLKAYQSKGAWQGGNPFEEQQGRREGARVAVLTRASIKPRYLPRFWYEVPAVSRHIAEQEGCLFSKGIGEWPLVEQATFSIWEREALMQNFAYREKEHARVVGLTRKLNWYREELFARFEIVNQEGELW